MKRVMLLILLTIILGGCGAQNQGNVLEEPKPLEVDVTFQPEEIKVGEEVVLVATVTMGKEKVADASEVKFELWKSGEEHHEMVDGENKNNGNYEMNKKFTEPGTYFVIPHVTARNLHAMPKVQFEVK